MIVLTAAYFIMQSESSTFRGMMRDLSAFIANKSEAAEIKFEYEDNGCYTYVENSIAVVTSNETTVFDKYGDVVFSEVCNYSQPAVKVNGKYAVSYDIGGREIKLFNCDRLIRSIEMQEFVISVSIDSKGWLAVCTEEDGYKGAVTVYDASGAAVYKWYSAEGYIVDVELSSENRMLTVLTASATGSNIISLSLGSNEVYSKYIKPDKIAMDIQLAQDGTVVCVMSDELLFVNQEGEQKSSYELSNKRLMSYKFAEDGSTFLICEDYTSGEYYVCTVSTSGEEIGSFTTSKKIKSAAFCKEFVAVVYSNEIIVYNKKLVEQNKYQPEEEPMEVFIRSDGAAMAVLGNKLRVYK